MTELKHLHDHDIRIDVSWEGTTKVFRGRGKYECDGYLGPVLGIAVEDPSGNFEFLISEDSWNSAILPDTSGESDYRICLESLPVCLN